MSPKLRRRACDKVLAYIGEGTTPETEKFITEWKVIHKVKPANQRDFKLAQSRRNEMLKKHSRLKELMTKLSY